MSARLHNVERPPDYRGILIRVGILVGILGLSILVIYLEGGHIDSQTGEAPGFIDVVYFAMVTITTVGYGDIVPVTPLARMMDAFVLTPMRFILLFVFVGIAYELAFKRLQENFQMNRIVSKLDDHIIVCGFGETGTVAVDELLAAGTPPHQIVVLDPNEKSLDEAASRGVITMVGDSRKERVLQDAAIERAAHVLICPGRDDTAVLIALTARELNPRAHLAAICHEQENVRVLQHAGLETIVTSAGGNLIAAATRRPHLVATLQDLLRVGGDLRLDERRVEPTEAGVLPKDLPGIVVVRVYRAKECFNSYELPALEPGDVIVFVKAAETAA